MEKVPPAEDTQHLQIQGESETGCRAWPFPALSQKTVLPPQGRAIEMPSQFLTDSNSGLWRRHPLAYEEPCPANYREIIQDRLRPVAQGEAETPSIFPAA